MNLDNDDSIFEIETLPITNTTSTQAMTSTLPMGEPTTEKLVTTVADVTEITNITYRFNSERILGMPEFSKDITLLTVLGILVLKIVID